MGGRNNKNNNNQMSDNNSESTRCELVSKSISVNMTGEINRRATDASQKIHVAPRPNLRPFVFRRESDGRITVKTPLPPHMYHLVDNGDGQIDEMFRDQGNRIIPFGNGFVFPAEAFRSGILDVGNMRGEDLDRLAECLFEMISETRGEYRRAVRRLFNALMDLIENESEGPVGLTDGQIANLPVIEASDGVKEIDCSVCRETTRVDAEKCVELGCKHCFHFGCIEEWLKRAPSCPVCRQAIRAQR